MVCGCNDSAIVITFMIPLVLGLVVGTTIDEVYFKIDRDNLVNIECGSLEKINAFTCPKYAETMPLWILLFPLGFIGLSFIIQILFYSIQDLINDRKGQQNHERGITE